MDVPALCLINVLLFLLLAQVQPSCSHKAGTFPAIAPSRLQVFEYESLFVNCEGFFNDLITWRVMRKIKGTDTICNSKSETRGPCTIHPAFSTDSGQYWCEADGKKSDAVNITVTDGPVILVSPAQPVMEGDTINLQCRDKMAASPKADFYKNNVLVRNSSAEHMTIHSVSKSDEGWYTCKISGARESPKSWVAVRAGSVVLDGPALPVMEGEAVTLRCRNKTTSSTFTADFYKDGRLVANTSSDEMNIRSVSKSDEGLYRCRISDGGESAERWLAVRAHQDQRPPPVSPAPWVADPWLVVTVTLVAVLLLMVLALYYMRQKVSAAGRSSATYAVSAKPRKTREPDRSVANPVYYALSFTEPQGSASAATPVSSVTDRRHQTAQKIRWNDSV